MSLKYESILLELKDKEQKLRKILYKWFPISNGLVLLNKENNLETRNLPKHFPKCRLMGIKDITKPQLCAQQMAAIFHRKLCTAPVCP